VTPTQSQISQGGRREDQLQIVAHVVSDKSSDQQNNTQQVHLSNMNFNTQDLIKMTQNTQSQGGRNEEDTLHAQTKTQPQQWNGSQEFYNSSMAYTQELQQKTKIYEQQEGVLSNDDTFRGINLQSFRDVGPLSNGTNTIGSSRRQLASQGVKKQDSVS
jgi:hypothetical protein